MPTILIFNKIDQFKDKEYPPFEDNPPATLEEWKQTYLAKTDRAIFISAVERTNIDELRKMLFREAEQVYYEIYPNAERFSYNQLWNYSGQEEQQEGKAEEEVDEAGS